MALPRSSEGQAAWLRARQVVLSRDNHRCVQCHELCNRGEADVHHLVPRSQGGGDEPSNLITLCDGCHGAVHPNQQAVLSQNFLRRWALKLALWLDKVGEFPESTASLSSALAVLGVKEFRGRQFEAVLSALRGQSLLLVSPTGSGKSLCFQVPALLTKGTTLVVSPLKALMADQVSSLQRIQIPSSFINSDLNKDEKHIRYGLVESNALKFLYVAPERFDSTLVPSAELARIAKFRPSLLVIDEAHCIDRWGSDFRKSYSRLGEVKRQLGNPPVLAFTATAGQETQRRILESLGIQNAKVIVTDIDRPNIALLRLDITYEGARFEAIRWLMSTVNSGRVMIFVPTRKVGEQIELGLKNLGLLVPFYHSKLDNSTRDDLFRRFIGLSSPPLHSIICTNAFGMGIDVPDVRLVIHWQHPASVEDYLQEFGRAGRDGKQSLAVLFANEGRDKGLLEFMAKHTVANAAISDDQRNTVLQGKVSQIELMEKLANNSNQCFRKGIQTYFLPPVLQTRKSISQRILEWLFLKNEKAPTLQWCCDYCHGATSSNYQYWVQKIFAK